MNGGRTCEIHEIKTTAKISTYTVVCMVERDAVVSVFHHFCYVILEEAGESHDDSGIGHMLLESPCSLALCSPSLFTSYTDTLLAKQESIPLTPDGDEEL